jgi:hypothetical protein
VILCCQNGAITLDLVQPGVVLAPSLIMFQG